MKFLGGRVGNDSTESNALALRFIPRHKLPDRPEQGCLIGQISDEQGQPLASGTRGGINFSPKIPVQGSLLIELALGFRGTATQQKQSVLPVLQRVGVRPCIGSYSLAASLVVPNSLRTTDVSNWAPRWPSKGPMAIISWLD
jgi:hypothetical protein